MHALSSMLSMFRNRNMIVVIVSIIFIYQSYCLYYELDVPTQLYAIFSGILLVSSYLGAKPFAIHCAMSRNKLPTNDGQIIKIMDRVGDIWLIGLFGLLIFSAGMSRREMMLTLAILIASTVIKYKASFDYESKD